MMLDVWCYRIIIATLCGICSAVTVGGISLGSQDKKLSPELANLASGCVGTLTGLLIPSPRSKNL